MPDAPRDILPAWMYQVLRCPSTGRPLRAMTADELAARHLPLEGALIRDDESACYPVEDGFPILLAERAIPLNRDETRR